MPKFARSPFATMRLTAIVMFLLQSVSLVDGILQTAAIDVVLSDQPPTLATYSIYVSQASFGSYPAMQPEKNPSRILTLPPDDNPLLCNNITLASSSNSGAPSIMLVPRGSCTFETKAYHAQQLGAKAILIYGTLASRYDLNTTNNQTYYTSKDIVFPQNYNDYDCSRGRALVPTSTLSFDPLPYNSEQNDPLLSGGTQENLCYANSKDELDKCPSKSCLLTGKVEKNNQMEACCAWDLAIWLYEDKHFDPGQVKIPAAYLTMEQGNQLLSDMQQNQQVSIVLYERWRADYNLSSFLIWGLGVAVSALAAYLSADDYHRLIRKAIRRNERLAQGGEHPERLSRDSSREERSRQVSPPPEDSMELTAAHALGFIIMASSSLLILFYFKIYGIVKVLYAMGCSKAVTTVIMDPVTKRIMKKFRLRDRIVWRTGTEDFGDITARDIVSNVAGYSLGVAWIIVAFANRHPENIPFFWIMQDIFGACMCIMFLQVIKLNSVRVAAILLMVAFFYDIFFVFITPLIFKGKSVMITVATSGGPPTADPLWCEKYPGDKNCQGGDPLPMLFTVPRLFDYQGGSSLLGLGDIVLPGLLLSFASRFDAAKSLLGLMGGGNGALNNSYSCPEKKFCSNCRLCSGGYFAPQVVAYAIGLLMANLAVYLMNMGQPALLYLVPSCLGTMGFMAWRRNELKDLWDGPKAIRAADTVVYGEYQGPTPVPQEDGIDVPTVPSAEEGDSPLLDENP